jgi:hypothetical protein
MHQREREDGLRGTAEHKLRGAKEAQLMQESASLPNPPFLQLLLYVPIRFMTDQIDKPPSPISVPGADCADDAARAAPPSSAITTSVARHDGWTGEKIAIFCETLAETAIVAEACDAAGMGISGAYACRRRNPVFAAAWDAALTIARERLADTLLARSMEGNVELIWKDGVCVGERHLLDNRLGLAILKRLDRLAERDQASCADTAPAQAKAPAVRREPFDWNLAIDALRTGNEDDICKALALIKGDKVEEVEGPPFFYSEGDNNENEIDFSDRCWTNHDGAWMTSFPPPSGFTGYENCEWGDPGEGYERDCTPEESTILEADAKRLRDLDRAEEEELRDSWFQILRNDLEGEADAA